MIKAVLVFLVIIVETIVVMAAHHFLGRGYSFVSAVGIIAADFCFVVTLTLPSGK